MYEEKVMNNNGKMVKPLPKPVATTSTKVRLAKAKWQNSGGKNFRQSSRWLGSSQHMTIFRMSPVTSSGAQTGLTFSSFTPSSLSRRFLRRTKASDRVSRGVRCMAAAMSRSSSSGGWCPSAAPMPWQSLSSDALHRSHALSSCSSMGLCQRER